MKIEAIFGGVLALLVVAITAAFLLTKTPGIDSANAAPAVAIAGHPLDILRTAGVSTDTKICECLKQGRSYGAQGLGPNSAEYATGYTMCRDLAGPAAADAWSVGFETAGARPLSCRRFLGSGSF